MRFHDRFLFRLEREAPKGTKAQKDGGDAVTSCTAVFLLDVHGAAAAKWKDRDAEVFGLASRGPGNLTTTARRALAGRLIRFLQVRTSKKRPGKFEAGF